MRDSTPRNTYAFCKLARVRDACDRCMHRPPVRGADVVALQLTNAGRLGLIRPSSGEESPGWSCRSGLFCCPGRKLFNNEISFTTGAAPGPFHAWWQHAAAHVRLPRSATLAQMSSTGFGRRMLESPGFQPGECRFESCPDHQETSSSVAERSPDTRDVGCSIHPWSTGLFTPNTFDGHAVKPS